MRKIFASLVMMTVMLGISAQNYRGTLITDTLRNSEIYPGTVREYKIYLPEQYKGDAPACLYLGLDGILYNAPAVMDSLIASGEMPITIGVFVQPGQVLDENGKVIRYNRSNEFDRTDGTFARFIETELLPAVKRHTSPSGLPVIITDDPDGRAISGASSSGIASFCVAWFRPDLFRRVYTTCGTYVAMRGGNELPALIRKTEPQPIRFYIHDGSNDAWNPLFGHWYEQNLLVASALEFAGYELETKWDDGNHSIRNGARLFPDAMRYLWKNYPERVKSGVSENNMLPEVLLPGEEWNVTETQMPQSAGKSALYPDGSHITEYEPNSDWLLNSIINAEGVKVCTQQFHWLHNPLHFYNDVIGMVYDKSGNLYVATSIGIQVTDQNGRVRVIIPYPTADKVEAFSFSDDMLYIKAVGKVYKRKIKAQAHPSDAPRIEVKSQGQA